MKEIKVLHIDEFGPEKEYSYFYSNTFKQHAGSFHEAISLPHKHDFFVLVFFSSGSGVHEIDFHSYPILPGSVFMMSPGQTHHWKFTADTDGFVLFHTREFYEMHFMNRSLYNFPFYYSVQNPSSLFIPDEDRECISGLFARIFREHMRGGYMSTPLVASLLDILYINMSRLYLQTENSEVTVPAGYTKKIRILERLIEEHYPVEKSASAYAAMMNISPKHLNRMVKLSLGKTVTELVADRVLLEAKRLLVHAPKSFAAIARTLGYEDYAYFSRFFRRNTGMTPSDFVRRYR
ncbi:AraC family transcriptional regulator [Sinomicrobium soli]|uniref:AraC family transcriptional regulator n=1 Tax=Sinomicrobium sp. N-1-3-6 TaxID=2219864 RepID=UPI000DCE6658|nr:AraC family transcriptional regulator [Sinomicrobium sp. N-1-3-6]RAV30571.1 AraC family transcriptional regulator [Sinomicrobium sp. N-1-3-6]